MTIGPMAHHPTWTGTLITAEFIQGTFWDVFGIPSAALTESREGLILVGKACHGMPGQSRRSADSIALGGIAECVAEAGVSGDRIAFFIGGVGAVDGLGTVGGDVSPGGAAEVVVASG